MPLVRAISCAIAVVTLGLLLSACASGGEPVYQPSSPPPAQIETFDAPQTEFASAGDSARMPREIRLGMADMVIQRVEPDVSRAEVAAAIEPLIANATVCMRWPALWIERVRRTSFVVRYALMARDWGEDAVSASQARMDEFVAMGFMTMANVDSLGERAVEYTMTAEGQRYLAGLIQPGRRPNFCAPAERHLVEVTSMEWGEYPCGTLQVHFTHTADAWPSWARSESTRAWLATSWPLVGDAAPGTVTLGRQWYRREVLPAGASNGALRSLCYDSDRQAVTGNDLNLSAAPLD